MVLEIVKSTGMTPPPRMECPNNHAGVLIQTFKDPSSNFKLASKLLFEESDSSFKKSISMRKGPIIWVRLFSGC